MHVVVCVKQVPDTTQVRVDPVTNTLIREGIPTVVNPFDYYALECALALKDRYHVAVTVLSMGPPDAVQTLTTCLSYGADHAVLLTDRAFAGSDTWATSYTLAAAIRKLAEKTPVDMVLCGKQTIDGDTAQTGPGIARHLGWQQVTATMKIDDITDGRLTATRKLEQGREVLRTELPAVITVTEEAAEIRYASLPNLLRALRYTPETLGAEDLAVEPAHLGLKGSPTRVKKIFPPPRRAGGDCVRVDEIGVDAAVLSAVSALRERGIL